MAENTRIEWCTHTFNAWVGCTKISPACAHCYAESWAKRSGRVQWNAPPLRTSPSNWLQPLAWDQAAAAEGIRPFVFCNSLGDVFDNQADPAWRADLFALQRATPHLTWLPLTKRIGNALTMCEAAGGLPSNAALMATICNVEEARRDLPKLLAAAEKLNPLFVGISVEPLLENVAEALRPFLSKPGKGGVEWVIGGGESGPRARPCHVDSARELRDVALDAGAYFLWKQWGEFLPEGQFDVEGFQWAPGSKDRRVHWWREVPDDAQVPEGACSIRIGKKQAGRSLDGRIHNERPRVS